MSKSKLTPVEQMAVDVRNELLTVLVPCKVKPFHLHPDSPSIASIAKAVGVTDPTLRSFAEGNTVSVTTLGRIQAFLTSRRDQAESEA